MSYLMSALRFLMRFTVSAPGPKAPEACFRLHEVSLTLGSSLIQIRISPLRPIPQRTCRINDRNLRRNGTSPLHIPLAYPARSGTLASGNFDNKLPKFDHDVELQCPNFPKFEPRVGEIVHTLKF
jgi:hypothetical protein